MRQFFLRLLLLALLPVFTLATSSAQDLVTSRIESGYVFEHPEDWRINLEEDADSIAYFDDGAMYGVISIIDNRFVGDDPEEVLEDLFDELERDDLNNGEFEEPFETYELDGVWEVVRATRVRRNDRLLEYFIMADGNDTSVFVRASFRRGGEDEYLAQFDAMIASVRHEDDERVVAENAELSSAELLGVDYIGTEGNLLQVNALTENYVFEDERYELDYPTGWEINANEDGSLRFVSREGVTLFGTIQVLERGENTAENALSEFLAVEEGYSPIESFSLNGLPAVRAYRENSRGGTTEIAMAAQSAETIVLLNAASNSEDFEALEPVLRAVLYSLRPNGTNVELSLVGIGARTGLNSAFVYGATTGSSNSTNSPQSSIPLEARFETENGDYQLNYPEAWTQEIEQNTIVLSNEGDYELFDPARGEVQMMVFFIDRIDNLRVDEFSPESILGYIIETNRAPELWQDISRFESLGRRGAFADFVSSDVDWVMRTYLVELDEEERIYVRIDMVAREDELLDFHPYALAILETVDFVD